MLSRVLLAADASEASSRMVECVGCDNLEGPDFGDLAGRDCSAAG